MIEESSWIKELSYDNESGSIIVKTTGKTYAIDASEKVYDDWVIAESKGKFWHQMIAGNYPVQEVAKIV